MDKKSNRDDLFRLHVLGVGGYFSEKYATTSFVVQTGMRPILIEAPAELPKKLKLYRELVSSRYFGGSSEVAGIDDLVLENLNDIIITHVHGDHSAGLELIAWYKMYKQKRPLLDTVNKRVLTERRPRLYGTREVFADLESSVNASFVSAGLKFDDFFKMVELEHGKPVQIGETQLVPYNNYHGIPGFGIMLSYKGKSLSYSGDTKFDSNFAGFLSEADVMVHEADGKSPVHTCPDQLARWKANSQYSGRLYVCHFNDTEVIKSQGLTPLAENEFIDI